MNAIEFSGVFKQYHKRNRLFSKSDLFWVLEDVSFSVRNGETVGLIGPNGAGKTTAMRLVAGIIYPTSGRVRVNGKVIPVISLDGCLQPLLNGRENIEFLAALYRLEAARRAETFSSIVEFSGLRDFLEMPVKHFSTGMRSRLAFSIAAHLPADIFLIDETLAVGDQAFQKKCLEKILSMKKEGKTILFTSHNAHDIASIAHRVLWLDRGRLVREGPPGPILETYAQSQAPGP